MSINTYNNMGSNVGSSDLVQKVIENPQGLIEDISEMVQKEETILIKYLKNRNIERLKQFVQKNPHLLKTEILTYYTDVSNYENLPTIITVKKYLEIKEKESATLEMFNQKDMQGIQDLMKDNPFILNIKVLKDTLHNCNETISLMDYTFLSNNPDLLDKAIQVLPEKKWMKILKSLEDQLSSPPILAQDKKTLAIVLKDRTIIKIENEEDEGATKAYNLLQHSLTCNPEKSSLFNVYLNPGHGFLGMQLSPPSPKSHYIFDSFGFYPRSGGKEGIHGPGWIQAEYSEQNLSKRKGHLSLSFPIPTSKASELYEKLEKEREECVKEKTKCRKYTVLGENCVDYTQEKFSELYGDFHFADFFSDEQLTEKGMNWENKAVAYTYCRSRGSLACGFEISKTHINLMTRDENTAVINLIFFFFLFKVITKIGKYIFGSVFSKTNNQPPSFPKNVKTLSDEPVKPAKKKKNQPRKKSKHISKSKLF